MKRIAIPIHWDAPDAGYSVLTSPKVASFLFQNLYHKNNLIQTYRSFQTRGKTVLCLQAKRFSAWTVRLPWKKITCTRKTGWLKASPCQTHNNHQKVFVNVPGNEYVAGFAAYLLQLISGKISVQKHREFVKVLQGTIHTAYIHNEEVDWFHVKQIHPEK